MTLTEANKTELLMLLSEQAPPDGRFSAAELEYLLRNATDIYEAAAHGWLRKQDKLIESGGLVTDIELGSERYKFATIPALTSYCQGRYKYFIELSDTYIGSALVLSMSPATIGVEELDALGEPE